MPGKWTIESTALPDTPCSSCEEPATHIARCVYEDTADEALGKFEENDHSEVLETTTWLEAYCNDCLKFMGISIPTERTN